MQVTNDGLRYGIVSQWLHWVTAALVIVLLVMGNAFDMDADEPGSALFFWHSSLGVLVFLLAVTRVGWLLFSRPPRFSQSMGRLSRILARSTHVALYALLFALPVSGWLAASSEGAAVSFFGIATIPQWRGTVSSSGAPIAPVKSTVAIGRPSKVISESDGDGVFNEIHEIMGNVLLVLASIHLLAALKHHFVNRDDVLRRMLPRARGTGGTPPPAHDHELT